MVKARRRSNRKRPQGAMTVTAEQIIRRLGLEPLPARQAAVHRDLLLLTDAPELVPCNCTDYRPTRIYHF